MRIFMAKSKFYQDKYRETGLELFIITVHIRHDYGLPDPIRWWILFCPWVVGPRPIKQLLKWKRLKGSKREDYTRPCFWEQSTQGHFMIFCFIFCLSFVFFSFLYTDSSPVGDLYSFGMIESITFLYTLCSIYELSFIFTSFLLCQFSSSFWLEKYTPAFSSLSLFSVLKVFLSFS